MTPTPRVAVSSLIPGDYVAERTVRGAVVAVERNPGVDVLCEVYVAGRLRPCLWHPWRRVGVVEGSQVAPPVAAFTAAASA